MTPEDAPPTPIEYAIGAETNTWMPVFGVASSLYAKAVHTGLVTPEEATPEILAALYPEQTQEWDLLSEHGDGWRTGIAIIHSLANGEIEDLSDPDSPTFRGEGNWTVEGGDWPDDITVADLRSAFGGDVRAAAAAFCRQAWRS